jgi:hypothetical protein
MNLNRRNVLIGIATVAMITGAALGSGAFTSVEADRALNVGLADDSNAILEMGANSSLVGTTTGTNGQTILQIDLQQLNDDAVTQIAPAFYIHNEMGEPVGVTINNAPSGVTLETNTNGQDITSAPAAGDDHALGTGDTVSVDMTIDSTGSLTTGSNTITIEANTTLAP